MTYSYINKNINQIKKHTKFFIEPLKNEYYNKNFKIFQKFCEQFIIDIDKFDTKFQILTMILFYLYFDTNNTQVNAFNNIRSIQLFIIHKKKIVYFMTIQQNVFYPFLPAMA